MNIIMPNLRTLAYVLVSAFALSVSTVDVASAQCKHYVYNPLLPTAQGVGGMDCVSIAMAAGTDGITGASLLTTANRVPVVNGAGELTQSDVALASGIFSRAGTLGLSASGANSVTLATNGTTHLTVDSSGNATFTQQISALYAAFSNPAAANGVLGTRLLLESGADGTLGALYTSFNMFPSATGSARYVTIQVGDNSAYRPLALQPAGGNLLIGTTTDDGSSKLQVSGSSSAGAVTLRISNTAGAADDIARVEFADAGTTYAVRGRIYTKIRSGGNSDMFFGTSNTGGTVVSDVAMFSAEKNLNLGGLTDGGYRLDVQSSGSSGTLRVYDQTAVTGSTSLVLTPGAGQSTNPLMNVDSGGIYLYKKGRTDVYLLDVQPPSTASGLHVRIGVASIANGFTLTQTAGSVVRIGIDPGTGGQIGFFGVTPAARAAALTAANNSALNTGDATSDTVIGNMRTRIGELETKLQAYGLLQ